MKQVLDAKRRTFIHDYDGVHYDYAIVPDIYAYLGGIKVFLAETLFPAILAEIGPDELKRIGVHYYHSTGDGLRGFVELAMEKMGVDEKEFQRELHILYNKTNLQRTLQDFPGIFAPCSLINRSLDNLRGHVRHGILTQSCVDNWARPGLKLQNRIGYFEEDAFVGFAEGGYVTKSHSTRPLETILKAMGAKPEESVFIEDSLPNLKKAKELDPRILTVHICHGNVCAVPDHVDIQVCTLDVFLNQVEALYAAPRQQPALTPGMY